VVVGVRGWSGSFGTGRRWPRSFATRRGRIRNHTLMQTIARANRVAPGKKAGLIVDYVGIFRNLQKALAIYAQPSRPGELPIKDKAALVEELDRQVKEAKNFLQARDIALDGITRETDASTSASVAEPIFSASRMRRAGVHSAWRRCALGMCSGIVVCRFLTAENAWLATRVPRLKISIVVLVILASTTSRMSREGTE
jgi:hypothetical protein